MRGVARRGDPAHLADMHAQEIDQALFDQQPPFVRVVEQLAHGDGRGAQLADVAEPFDIFRGERIFEEEQLERFNIFGKLDGIDRRKALVDIVEQLHLIANAAADVLDHLEHVAGVSARVVVGALRARLLGG